ncbi:hypothetical protein BGZ74_004768, partial [Mortierella antarctica]
DVKRSLHYGNNVTVINANTDCPNVRYEVRVSNDIRSCHEELEFLLDFKKMIIYFDKMNDMMAVYRHLRVKAEASQPSLHQSDIITYFNADLKTETKELYMSKFK